MERFEVLNQKNEFQGVFVNGSPNTTKLKTWS